MRTGSRPRILIAKPGLDGHDRGAKVVCRALTNAGMEVIYSGLHQTPLQIVHTARDEDVDGIGLSVLSGAHNTIFAKLINLLQQEEMGEVLVFGGGAIPQKDWPGLHALGVGRIFPPGTDTKQIVAYLEDTLSSQATNETSERQHGV
jgi:methylmalonyl-CoA mutase C-terminal domain/subunit